MRAIPEPSPVHTCILIAGNETATDLPAALVDLGRMRTYYSRWHLSPIERIRVLLQGDIGLYQLHTGHAVQPMFLDTRHPYPAFWFFWLTRAHNVAVRIIARLKAHLRSLRSTPKPAEVNITAFHLSTIPPGEWDGEVPVWEGDRLVWRKPPTC